MKIKHSAQFIPANQIKKYKPAPERAGSSDNAWKGSLSNHKTANNGSSNDRNNDIDNTRTHVAMIDNKLSNMRSTCIIKWQPCYALTGDTSEQAIFILYGTGSNGKSTLLNVFSELMATYSQSTPSDTFMQKKNESVNNDIARLKGARFVSAIEMEENKRMI